eukprot:108902_1
MTTFHNMNENMCVDLNFKTVWQLELLRYQCYRDQLLFLSFVHPATAISIRERYFREDVEYYYKHTNSKFSKLIEQNNLIEKITFIIKHKITLKYGMYSMVNYKLITNKRYNQIVKLLRKDIEPHDDFETILNDQQYEHCHVHLAKQYIAINEADYCMATALQITLQSSLIATNSKRCFFQFKWNKLVSDFSLYDWCLLLILFMINNKLNNKNIACTVTHKINKKPSVFKTNYEPRLQLTFDSIIYSSKLFSKLFAGATIMFCRDRCIDNDMAMLFDTSQWVYIYFKNICGIILENRRDNPAYAYHVAEDSNVWISDYKSNIFKQLYLYLKYRIQMTYLKTNTKLIVSKRVSFKFHLKYVYRRLLLNLTKDLQYENFSELDYYNYEKRHEKVILPLRLRRLKKCTKRMNKKYRDKCDVCGRMECYTMDEIGNIKDSTHKFVFELKCCPCRQLLVCGKKCQKIAWNCQGHRTICTHKI